MKYLIERSRSFKKSFKKLNTGKQELVLKIIHRLANDKPLEQKHKDHALKGEYIGFRECHIKPDLLLIYQKDKHILILTCIDVGSHSELF
ncbi:type II toxin-antitoxin system YafQ family toxin [uncultured Helicobacter sp.]|uniref:type II toxin-antitoxin system YafQ family toxin n=1 Tax=uncultured Helicobacter sp. TaxID=175537 RepID=UPI00260AA476|nr:type II toxin-antitoxin system YafQ family toxin [uncultured Helicobacter sp.]